MSAERGDITHMHDQAVFVRRPRTGENIKTGIGMVLDYEIIKTIRLNPTDYENFVTDMLADRVFLEESADAYAERPPVKCLLVCGKDRSAGILVLPRGAYVELAALYSTK